MKLRVLAVVWAGVATSGLLGCSSDTQHGAPAGGGAAGSSGASQSAGESGRSGSGAGGANTGGAPASDGACLEHPTPQRPQRTLLSLPPQPVMAGKPFVFGQPNALADGGSLVPLNFRFYISKVELLPNGSAGP